MSNASHMTGGILLAGLTMSVGWGIRGDYGHEAGAMIPGALLGLAVCLAGGREDWWRRARVMGMCGAIGWAFGGQMSYGRIVGYTASSSLPDVFYGYACLFVIGGLWAGIGVGTVFLLRIAPRLSGPADDSQSRWLRTVSLILLAPVMMWLNLSKNVTNWVSGNHVPGEVLGIASTGWFLAIGVVLATASMVAIIRQHQGTLAMSAGSDFGRAHRPGATAISRDSVGVHDRGVDAGAARDVQQGDVLRADKFLDHVRDLLRAGACPDGTADERVGRVAACSRRFLAARTAILGAILSCSLGAARYRLDDHRISPRASAGQPSAFRHRLCPYIPMTHDSVNRTCLMVLPVSFR